MSLKVISEKDNLLFSRKEVALNYEAKVVPSKVEVVKLISDKYKSKPELIRVQKIQGKFGSNVFVITADIYSNQEEFNRLIKKTKKELDEEKKAEEARKAEAEEAKRKVEEEKAAKEEAKKAEAEAKKVLVEESKEEVAEVSSEEEKVEGEMTPKGVPPIEEAGGKK